jgi:hypothetical protein
MRGGRGLLAAARAPSPLDRLLAAVRVALGLLADALRPSADPQDAPLITLGHHYISLREVPDGEGRARERRGGEGLGHTAPRLLSAQRGPTRGGRLSRAVSARAHSLHAHPAPHAPARTAGASPPAAGGSRPGTAQQRPSTAATGSLLRLQEITTFDPREGPKRYAVPEHEVRPQQEGLPCGWAALARVQGVRVRGATRAHDRPHSAGPRARLGRPLPPD